MKILVTGGAGYLGSVIVPKLLSAGHRVRVLDTLRHRVPSLLSVADSPQFEFENGDARDAATLKRNLTDADVIIPLAALVGAPACDRDPEVATSTNVGAIQLLNSLRSPAQRVVYPTTNSGYGTQSGAVYCTEETPLEPISLYGRTKVEGERLILDSPNTIALRLATVFGVSPRMRVDLLVNTFVWEAVHRRYIVVFEKDFKRNYVHIKDVADCFVHCLDHFEAMTGRTYNCGLDDANCSKAELVELIKAQVPGFYAHYAEVGVDPDKRNYIVSNERLRQAGFQARRSLPSGISELLRCYRMLPNEGFSNQ